VLTSQKVHFPAFWTPPSAWTLTFWPKNLKRVPKCTKAQSLVKICPQFLRCCINNVWDAQTDSQTDRQSHKFMKRQNKQSLRPHCCYTFITVFERLLTELSCLNNVSSNSFQSTCQLPLYNTLSQKLTKLVHGFITFPKTAVSMKHNFLHQKLPARFVWDIHNKKLQLNNVCQALYASACWDLGHAVTLTFDPKTWSIHPCLKMH